jgi:N6-L-threonylcarbamoyladenine synthase/protein kinase Bud32
MRKLSEGAESRIYQVRVFGIDGIMKRRAKKGYRIREIDDNLRVQRTKKEARIMSFVLSYGIRAPTPLLVDKYDILMSRVHGSNLNDLLDSKADFGKIFSVLGNYAAILHNNNIVHGDYTPANMMVCKNGQVYLIDFGLSEMANSINEKALDLLLMKRSVSKAYFHKLVDSYKVKCKDSGTILKRLERIEKMGRYNTRTLLAD